MNTELIKLFNAALVENETLNFAEVNKFATLRGYIVMPEVCNSSVMNFLRSIDINPNATFYKTIEDVTSKSRFDLFIDQMFHYMTTYGTNFSLGNGYVPNDGEIDYTPVYKEFKVIKAITKEELYDRCMGLLTSGIALKKSTMTLVADYIIKNINKDTFNIDAIKNREAVTYFSDKLNIFPNNGIDLLRYIVYKTTGNTLLIKNRATISAIKNSYMIFDFSTLSESNMKALASCFLRFKDIFLAFKSKKGNAYYINKLRRMANTYHTPMKQGFWQTIFNSDFTIKDLNDNIDKLTPFKMVALMQTCLERSKCLEDQLYVIRNQKVYVRRDYKPSTDVTKLMIIYGALRAKLIEVLKNNSMKQTVIPAEDSMSEPIIKEEAKIIRTISGMKVCLPSSEKSFIGNYPFGTSYKLTGNNFFGVYWKNEWGTRDYDLSFTDFYGKRIGWNANYYSGTHDIVFSGDMTNANPEAAEVLAFRKNCGAGIIKVNQFSTACASKFRFFFGQEDGLLNHNKVNHTGYFAQPENIKLMVDVEHEANHKENMVGVTNGDEIVLMAINTGNESVSRTSINDVLIKAIGENILHKSKCFVDAAEILEAAGYKIVDETYTGDVDIDFKSLDKDSLISLMK